MKKAFSVHLIKCAPKVTMNALNQRGGNYYVELFDTMFEQDSCDSNLKQQVWIAKT